MLYDQSIIIRQLNVASIGRVSQHAGFNILQATTQGQQPPAHFSDQHVTGSLMIFPSCVP